MLQKVVLIDAIFYIILIICLTSSTNGERQCINDWQNHNRLQNNSLQQQNPQHFCGGVYEQDEVVVNSPGYPNGYPPFSECVYSFQGPDTCKRRYRFKILDFNLEQSLGCVKDRLEIQDKDAICGSTYGTKDYDTLDGQLRIRFISDSDISGRGFRILVTKLACEEEFFDNGIYTRTTIVPAFPVTTTTTQRPFPPIFPTLPPPVSNLPFCCAGNYNSRHFLIASPDFPRSNTIQTDCVYHIYRSNPNICRLRLHMIYFWTGESYPGGDNTCNRGYLEIDGRKICGCRTGLNMISNFDPRWGNKPKEIRFKSYGIPQAPFTGFVMEVIQDECPKRYDYNNGIRIKRESVPISYGNDQIVRLSKDRIETLDDVDFTSYAINLPNVVKHLYFFKAPDDDEDEHKIAQEKEQTTYLDTSDRNFYFPNNGQDTYQCRIWGLFQWTRLTNLLLWQQMPKCRTNQLIPENPESCHVFNGVRGSIQSPGFPRHYPNNLRICYRFQKQFGYCGFELRITDFQLEASENCVKDHLLFGKQYKYCGNALHRTLSTINLANKDYEDVYFVSDSYYCDRGFHGIYEQVPCRNAPPPTLIPSTTPLPPIIPVLCGGDIDADFYILEVPPQADYCSYRITKSRESVCRLELIFLNFNVKCGGEQTILINGNEYCGTLTGRKQQLDFSRDQLKVVYKSSSINPPESRSPIRISISQIREGCDPFILDIPAERRLTQCTVQELANVTGFINVDTPTVDDNKNDDDADKTGTAQRADNCGYIFQKVEGYCDLQLNLSSVDIPENKDCLRSYVSVNRQRVCGFTNQTLDIPFTNRMLEISVKLNETKKTNQMIPYKQIPCPKNFGRTQIRKNSTESISNATLIAN